MPHYRRPAVPGGTWFFTVNLHQRRGNDLLVRHIDLLRATVASVRTAHPFRVLAWVVLPDHMHWIWRLPDGDAGIDLRWRLIKRGFTRRLPHDLHPPDTASRRRRGERGVWQRRYWDHLIRDADDLHRHVDYVHFNPVKHGLVETPDAWPHSSYHGHPWASR